MNSLDVAKMVFFNSEGIDVLSPRKIKLAASPQRGFPSFFCDGEGTVVHIFFNFDLMVS